MIRTRPSGLLVTIAVFGCLMATWVTSVSAAVSRWDKIADVVFQHIAPDDGSARPVATAVAEDGSGFLWIGTEDGLSRWDGYRFQTYRPNSADLGSLPDNWIKCLHTDSRGRLWIGTSAGGLARYDPDHDRFIRFDAGPAGVSNANVRSIVDDGAGGLWVGTDGGLDHIDPFDGITHFHHDANDALTLPDDRIVSLLLDRTGALWVGTRTGGLLRRGPGANGFLTIELPVPKYSLHTITSLFEDRSGRVWVGTRNQGAFVIGHGETILHAVPSEDGSNLSFIVAIAETATGEIWLGTYGRGIVAVDPESWEVRRIRSDNTRSSSLIDDTVCGLYRDHAGLMWVGTDRGVDKQIPNQAILTLFGGMSKGLVSGVDVDSVLVADDGLIWLGLRDSGVDILDPKRGLVGALRPDPAHVDTALRSGVWAMAAAAGSVYLGTGNGLYRSDAAGRHVTRVAVSKQHPDMEVIALSANDSDLWIGGTTDGLWKLDLHTGEATHHFEPNQPNRLSDQRVSVIASAPDGGLWVGTDNGLNKVDPASMTVEQILPDPLDMNSLPAGNISSLMTDRQGRLWVGTMGGGIAVLVGRDSRGRARFHHLGVAEGMPNANVDQMLSDSSGKIWVSTDDGIAVIEPQSFSIRALHRADGIEIPSYWATSGGVTREGELLFGGLGGLTVIRPDEIVPWRYRPPIVVTDIRAGGKSVPAGRFNRPGNADPLVVEPGANSLAVEFAALDFSAPERSRYAYQLEDFDKDWTQTDATRRLAAYTNLSPGHYRLRLRGSNRVGAWTETVLDVPVRVLPAWYQMLWFKCAVVLAACLAVLVLLHVRTLTLLRRQHELEDQVLARTTELLQTQRQLEQIAYIDALTSLPNRRMFDEAFRQQLAAASREQQRFALLLLDLDGLKKINDTRGHGFGDALLVEAAARLRASVRDADPVARLGGDEFAILLADVVDRDGIEVICQRIVDSFAAPFLHQGQAMSAGVSIGVAIYPTHAATQDVLFRAADASLYVAKRAGGGRWVWHSDEVVAW